MRRWALVGLLALGLVGCAGGEPGRVETSVAVTTRSAATVVPVRTSSASNAGRTATSSSTTRTPTPPKSGCSNAISWEKAVDHVGERATVRGPVKGANYAKGSNGQPTFLDVGKAYPDASRFTVLVWGTDRAAFPKPPETAYANKTICVTGLITSYKGGAEIEAHAAADIVVD